MSDRLERYQRRTIRKLEIENEKIIKKKKIVCKNLKNKILHIIINEFS